MEDFALEESEDERASQMLQRLNDLGGRLEKICRDQVSARSEIEDRWIEDIRQYSGRYDPVTEQKLLSRRTASRVFVNITRSKVNEAEAKLADMVLPSDDRNWMIRPTPVPEKYFRMKDMLDNEQAGQESTEPDEMLPQPEGLETVAPPTKTEAEKAKGMLQKHAQECMCAHEMQDAIDDQLKESNYNAVCRDIIHDAAILGIGIIKGPVVVGKTRRSWDEIKDSYGNAVQIVVEEDVVKPTVERVDPWNFFPDMSAAKVDDAEFIFERSYLTRKKLRALIKRPGFIEENIERLLVEGPQVHRIDTQHLVRIREINNHTGISDDNKYEVWTYHGPLYKEDLEAAGVEIKSDSEFDMLDSVVWFCGNLVLKAQVNIMETGDFPYSVMTWERDDSSIFGFGIPYQMRNSQKVINGVWRMALENSGLATGPQLVINKMLIEPADGKWELTARKIWYTKERNVNIGQAFAAFDINSHQQELMNLFDYARRLVDEETNLPSVPIGEGGTTTPTGAMAMILQNSNSVFRRVVKEFDDNITEPTITRFYDWNMQFSERDEIKGDYEVDARGSSTLMVKEAQNQNLIGWINLLQHPVFGRIINPDVVLEKLAKRDKLEFDGVIKTKEQIAAEDRKAQEAAQSQEPEAVQVEKLRLQGLQHKMQVTYQMHQDRMQRDDEGIALDVQKLLINRDIEIMRLMQERELGGEEIKAELAKASMNVNAKTDEQLAKLLVQDEYEYQPATYPGEEM